MLRERPFLMVQEVGRGCRLVAIEARFAGADGAAGSAKNAVVLEEMGDTIAAAGAHHAVKESLENDDMRRGDVEPEKSGEDSAEKAGAGLEKEYIMTVAEVERLREEFESLKRKVEEIQADKETAAGATREKDAQTVKLRAELEELHAFISQLQTAGLNARYGDCAHWASTDEDNPEKASLATNENGPEWVLDSGASKHVAGKSCVFESYNKHPPSHTGTIQTADGTKQPVIGVGTVKCTPTISLSSVLHVPAFPVNLVSFSALIYQIDCRVILDKFGCEIQEQQTRQTVGTGTRHRGLWYMDQGVQPDLVCAATMEDKEKQAMIHHCRMGHVSFDKMSRIFSDVMCGIGKGKLTCDACECAKHTRATCVSKGLRSISPFMLIHLDVWKSPVVSVHGMKYFVTFIDCYTSMTWIYLMRHKDEVFSCFQNFHALVKNQFKVQVQVIKTDNGTEYVNNTFGAFLSDQGILHQTSCPDTPLRMEWQKGRIDIFLRLLGR